VVVGSGAKVLGNLTIGDDTRIGANSVVLTDVPSHSTVVGIPGKIVRHQGLKRDDVLAHANLPDPIAEAIAYLNARVNQLEGELKKTGKDLPRTPLPACEDPVMLQMLGDPHAPQKESDDSSNKD
jgi:serine O-acetyltransferase